MKKFTVYGDGFRELPGAPVGSKESVFKWMQNNFPNLVKAPEIEEMDAETMVPGRLFFYQGEVNSYQTTKCEMIYLVEVVD